MTELKTVSWLTRGSFMQRLLKEAALASVSTSL
jgi:hypothetical protein